MVKDCSPPLLFCFESDIETKGDDDGGGGWWWLVVVGNQADDKEHKGRVHLACA